MLVCGYAMTSGATASVTMSDGGWRVMIWRVVLRRVVRGRVALRRVVRWQVAPAATPKKFRNFLINVRRMPVSLTHVMAARWHDLLDRAGHGKGAIYMTRGDGRRPVLEVYWRQCFRFYDVGGGRDGRRGAGAGFAAMIYRFRYLLIKYRNKRKTLDLLYFQGLTNTGNQKDRVGMTLMRRYLVAVVRS